MDIRPYGYYWKDETRNDGFSQVLQKIFECKFTDTEEFKFPTKFSSGKFFTWEIFKLKNISDSNSKFLLHGNIEHDSVWIYRSEKGWIGYSITLHDFKRLNPNEELIGYDRFIFELKAGEEIILVIKQKKIHYDQSNIAPRISSFLHYEKEYMKRMKNIILFYYFIFSFITAILFLILIHFLYFRRKVLFLYSLYLFFTILIAYRNYDYYSLYGFFTLGHFSWSDTRLIQTAIIFLSYAYFIIHFLEFKIPFPKIILKILTGWFIIAVILDCLARLYKPELSYYLYYISRLFITTSSLVIIILVWKSIHRLSKYILIGTLVLLCAELASNFVSGFTSSLITNIGVMLEIMIFTIVLGIWSLETYNAQKNSVLLSEIKVAEKNEQIANMRKDFALDIHDELGSTVSKLSLEAYYLKQKHGDRKMELGSIEKNLNYLAKQIKDIVWLFEEDKTTFTEFQTYLRILASDYFSNLPIQLEVDLPEPEENIIISLSQKRHLLAISKEIFANIIKHSHSNRVKINCSLTSKNLILIIKDFGDGFDLSMKSKGNGLLNMKKRAAKINAEITLINDSGCEARVIVTL